MLCKCARLRLQTFSRETPQAMELPRALSLLRDAVAASSQVRVAGRIGVSNGTVSRWIKGDVMPTGETLEQLMAWAVSVETAQQSKADAAKGIPPAVVAQARRELAETHRELARIYGYAESIADIADQVASRQRQLLTMLSPWVDTETDVRAGKYAEVFAALEQLDRAAELPTPIAPPDAPPAVAARRKRKRA